MLDQSRAREKSRKRFFTGKTGTKAPRDDALRASIEK
jgi:hypothetical protein